jgi:GTPase Era involved in 16S rRNA processing
VICEHIRSALLNSVPANIAYKLKMKVNHFEQDDDELKIIAHVICDEKRWGRIVAKALEEQTPKLEENFKEIFKQEVMLEIVAKFEGKTVQ